PATSDVRHPRASRRLPAFGRAEQTSWGLSTNDSAARDVCSVVALLTLPFIPRVQWLCATLVARRSNVSTCRRYSDSRSVSGPRVTNARVLTSRVEQASSATI